MRGILYILSGPSCAGKTTLQKIILQSFQRVRRVVSHTTRPMREGEEEGVNYYYTNRAAFEEDLSQEAFCPWFEFNGNYYGAKLAVIRQQLSEGHDLVLDMDYCKVDNVKAAIPNCRTIFVMPPSLTVIEQRLQARGDTADSIAARLKAAEDILLHAPKYDHMIVNHDGELEQTSAQIKAIFQADATRNFRQEAKHADLYQQFGIPRIHQLLNQFPILEQANRCDIATDPLKVKNPHHYKVTHKEKAFFLRTPDQAPKPWHNRALEANNLQILCQADLDITPQIYGAESDGVLLAHYVEGAEPLTQEYFHRNQTLLPQVAVLLRTLHSADIQFPEASDLANHLHTLTETLKSNTVPLPDNLSDTTQRALALLEDTPKTVVPSHNAVSPKNMLLDEGKLQLINWKYAGAHSPYFDLASVSVHAELDEEQTLALLAGYHASEHSSQHLHHLILFKPIVLLLHSLALRLQSLTKTTVPEKKQQYLLSEVRYRECETMLESDEIKQATKAVRAQDSTASFSFQAARQVGTLFGGTAKPTTTTTTTAETAANGPGFNNTGTGETP